MQSGSQPQLVSCITLDQKKHHNVTDLKNPENLFEPGSVKDSVLPPVPKAARQLIDIDLWTDLDKLPRQAQGGGLSGTFKNVQHLVAAKGVNLSGCGFTWGKSMEGGRSSLASCSQEGGPETASGAPQLAPHPNSEKMPLQRDQKAGRKR